MSSDKKVSPDQALLSARSRSILQEVELKRLARLEAAAEKARRKRRPKTVEEQEELIRDRGAAVEHLWFLSARELLELSAPTRFLIEDTIPMPGVVIVAGSPGAGKTLLINDLAIALATGRPWLGINHGHKHLRTLWINHDTPGPMMAWRMQRLGMLPKHQILTHTIGGKEPIIEPNVKDDDDEDNGPPAQLPSALTLPAAREQIMAMIDYFQPHLIVFDSLRQSHTFNENDSAEVAELMRQFRRFTTRGAAVVILHHLKKIGNEQPNPADLDAYVRGSGELLGSADGALVVVDNKKGVKTIYTGKTRGWQRKGPPSINFETVDLPDGGLQIVPVSELKPLMLMLSQGPMSRREIARSLGLGRDATKTLVEEGISSGALIQLPRSREDKSFKIGLAPQSDEDDEDENEEDTDED